MARIGLPATVSVRPMPTPVHSGGSCSCPSNIISSPTVIRYNQQRSPGNNGLASKFCRCCSCIHVDFMKRTPGFLKLAEAVSISSNIVYRVLLRFILFVLCRLFIDFWYYLSIPTTGIRIKLCCKVGRKLYRIPHFRLHLPNHYCLASGLLHCVQEHLSSDQIFHICKRFNWKYFQNALCIEIIINMGKCIF